MKHLEVKGFCLYFGGYVYTANNKYTSVSNVPEKGNRDIGAGNNKIKETCIINESWS